MTLVDLGRARRPPFEHQKAGVEALIKWDDKPAGRIYGGCFGLFDEMGAGKTKQIIDAAQIMHERGEIERVLVVCPAQVRSVWYEPELGQLAGHLWLDYPSLIAEYHSRSRRWDHATGARPLQWVITNYDFVRDKKRLAPILAWVHNAKTWLVLDESSAIKNASSVQTKAVIKLRKEAHRVVELNGTPISHSPLDMFSQMLVLHPGILGCPSIIHFRARYAVMGGWQNRQVLGWQNLEDLQKRVAPYVLRRLKRDCLDLPPALDPVTVTVPLKPATWTIYKDMRDELVAWLDKQTVSVSAQAGVKAMRLAQICAGFLGGLKEIQNEDLDPATDLGLPYNEVIDDRPDFIPRIGTNIQDERGRFSRKQDRFSEVPVAASVRPTEDLPPREIGDEKLVEFLWPFLDAQLEQDPALKLLVWCRFRPEVRRLLMRLRAERGVIVGAIWGGATKAEKAEAERLLDPRTAPKGPVVVVGTPGAGGVGLNLTASHTVVYMSNGTSLFHRLQSEARVDRPGQTETISYFDVVATGPNGQKTIDHVLLKALRAKEDLATWTCSAWVKALRDE